MVSVLHVVGAVVSLNVVTVLGQSVGTYTEVPNKHCPQGGLWPFRDVRHTATFAQCQTYCDSDAACVAFLYHPTKAANQCWPKQTCASPTVDHPTGNTYIKQGSGGGGAAATAATVATTPAATVTYLQVNNSHCPGGGLWPQQDPRHTATHSECQKMCDDDSACVGFLYHHVAKTTNQCWPKTVCSNYTTHVTGTTYVKQVVSTPKKSIGQATGANMPGKFSCHVCYWYRTDDVNYVQQERLVTSRPGRQTDCLDQMQDGFGLSSNDNCTFCSVTRVYNSPGDVVFVERQCEGMWQPLALQYTVSGYQADSFYCQTGDYCNQTSSLRQPSWITIFVFVIVVYLLIK